MSRKFRPESRFTTYLGYVGWYRTCFDGDEHMLTPEQWRDRFGK